MTTLEKAARAMTVCAKERHGLVFRGTEAEEYAAAALSAALLDPSDEVVGILADAVFDALAEGGFRVPDEARMLLRYGSRKGLRAAAVKITGSSHDGS